MDYPFRETNWICRLLGHRYGPLYSGYTLDGVHKPDVIMRRTCKLDGSTVPPFRKVSQQPPYDYLPDDEQPPGAI